MAAPPTPRGQATIVNVSTGAITPAPAIKATPRSTLTLDGVKTPETLYRLLSELYRELDDLRGAHRSVFTGSTFLRGVKIPAGQVTLVQHRLGRAPLGCMVAAPLVATATAVAGMHVIARVDLPTGRSDREWIALACANDATADLLVF